MRTIHRTLAWLLALLVLVSLLCPAMAFAAENSDQNQQSAAEAEKAEPASGTSQADSGLQKPDGSADNIEDVSDGGEKKEADSEKQEDSAEDGADKEQSQTGSLEKKSDDATTAGNLSSADGSQKQSRRSSVMELFISENGSDETGNGTYEAPFATLNAALKFAGDSDVEIILSLMTDLCLSETVPVVGNVVTVTGDDGAKKITRAEDFNGHFDPEEEHSTALFEVGTADPENNPGGSLLIEGIVIDEEFMQTDPVQDAMIEVYDRGKLILGDDVFLLNYGGESAVHGWAGSEVVVSDGAWILDKTTVEDNGTFAVQHDEGCTYSQGAASIVLSHGEEYDEIYGEKQEEENEGNVTGTETDVLTGTGKGTEADTVAGSTSNTDDARESKGKDSSDKTDSEKTNSGSEDDVNGEDGSKKAEDEETDNKDSDNENADNEGNGNTDDADDSDDENTNTEDSALSAPAIQKNLKSSGGVLLAADNASSSLGEENESTKLFSISAPNSISSSDTKATINSYSNGGAGGYPVEYTILLNLNRLNIFSTGIDALANTLTGADIVLNLELDSLLYPETESAGSSKLKITPNFSFMKIAGAEYTRSTDETSQQTTAAVKIELVADESTLTDKTAIADELKKELTLTFITVVPEGATAHSEKVYPQKDSVSSSVAIGKLIFAFGSEPTELTPPTTKSSAETNLLGEKTATLNYRANGGNDGPGTQKLPAETDHRLETSNVPTHADLNGTKVLFYGWTTEKDTKIYTNGETAPKTIPTLTLEEGNEYNVYAVYSTDRNDDGEPDVDQLTLGFDGNAQNVTNVPEPIIKSANDLGFARFNIPEQEPTCKYYTFLGWSENKDATKPTYKYDEAGETDKTIKIREDTLLYAVWKANPVYTLYYDGNGGTNVPAAQSAPSDNGVANLTITNQIPTRTGRTFVGWATQRYGTATFEPGEAVKLTGGDVTLYAVWERNSSWSNGAPKTGDESNVPLYAVLAVCSAGAAYAVYRILKKRGGR